MRFEHTGDADGEIRCFAYPPFSANDVEIGSIMPTATGAVFWVYDDNVEQGTRLVDTYESVEVAKAAVKALYPEDDEWTNN